MAVKKEKVSKTPACPYCEPEIAKAAFPFCKACGVKAPPSPKGGKTVPPGEKKGPHCSTDNK